MKTQLMAITAALAALTATAVRADTPTVAAEGDDDSSDRVVVVTATRNPQTLAETTSAVTVITRQQIEDKKAFDITDVIRLTPALNVAQVGTRGKQTGVFVRGALPAQTLVLVDGARINQPTSGAYDFGTFPVENIERIEVLRGPQSALYGSAAMGGVINIITRRGSGEFKTTGNIEFGNHATDRQSATARGTVGKGDLSLAITRLHSSGLFDNDDFHSLSTSLRYDRDLSAHSQLAFIGRASTGEVGVPGSRQFFYDPNERNVPHEWLGCLQYTGTRGRRSDRAALSLYRKTLRDNNPFNPQDPPAFQFASDSRSTDRVLSLEGQSRWNAGRHAVTAGFEVRSERGTADAITNFGPSRYARSTNTRAVFAQDEWTNGKFTLVPGVRWEDNSQFGSSMNGRLAAAYHVSAPGRIKASVGTGFRAPSFDQLYYPGFSNPNLDAEKSSGFDLGYEHRLAHGGRIEATAFRTNYRNLIANVVAGPVNIAHATVEGLELAYSQPLAPGLHAVVNHTFLNTSSSRAPLVRRPKFISTADLIYRRHKLNYDLGLVAQGRRHDVDAGGGTQAYGGYTRFDLTVGYDIHPQMQLYVRAQNLFNRKYEEVATYPAQHLNFVVGVRSGMF